MAPGSRAARTEAVGTADRRQTWYEAATIRELAAFALRNAVDRGQYAALPQHLSSAVHKPELGSWPIPF